MAKYSRAHEREEVEKMWRGFWHSTFGILFCWVPLVGLLFSVSGFARQAVRMTEAHKKRLILLAVYGLLSLMVSIGAILAGLYAYSRNPDVFADTLRWGWKQTTGADQLPWEPDPIEMPGGEGMPEELSGFTDPSAFTGEPAQGEEPTEVPLPADEYGGAGPEGETGLDGEGDSVPDSATANGDVPVDDALSGLLGTGVVGSESGGVFTPEGESAVLGYEPYDFPFHYQVVSAEPDAQAPSRILCKVVIDTDSATDEELTHLYEEVILADGYALHTVLVYRDVSETAGEATVASLTQTVEGEEPELMRKS